MKGLSRRTPLRVNGVSDTSQLKKRIQELLRAIVIARDGGISNARDASAVLCLTHLLVILPVSYRGQKSGGQIAVPRCIRPSEPKFCAVGD